MVPLRTGPRTLSGRMLHVLSFSLSLSLSLSSLLLLEIERAEKLPIIALMDLRLKELVEEREGSKEGREGMSPEELER